MNRRAREFAQSLRSWLGAFGGAGVASVSVKQHGAWTTVRFGMVSDDAARLIAADLGLGQARTEQRGRVWWREYFAVDGETVIISAGPTQRFDGPEDWPRRRAGALPS